MELGYQHPHSLESDSLMQLGHCQNQSLFKNEIDANWLEHARPSLSKLSYFLLSHFLRSCNTTLATFASYPSSLSSSPPQKFCNNHY